jgi:hypothetical protein
VITPAGKSATLGGNDEKNQSNAFVIWNPLWNQFNPIIQFIAQ